MSESLENALDPRYVVAAMNLEDRGKMELVPETAIREFHDRFTVDALRAQLEQKGYSTVMMSVAPDDDETLHDTFDFFTNALFDAISERVPRAAIGYGTSWHNDLGGKGEFTTVLRDTLNANSAWAEAKGAFDLAERQRGFVPLQNLVDSLVEVGETSVREFYHTHFPDGGPFVRYRLPVLAPTADDDPHSLADEENSQMEVPTESSKLISRGHRKARGDELYKPHVDNEDSGTDNVAETDMSDMIEISGHSLRSRTAAAQQPLGNEAVYTRTRSHRSGA